MSQSLYDTYDPLHAMATCGRAFKLLSESAQCLKCSSLLRPLSISCHLRACMAQKLLPPMTPYHGLPSPINTLGIHRFYTQENSLLLGSISSLDWLASLCARLCCILTPLFQLISAMLARVARVQAARAWTAATRAVPVRAASGTTTDLYPDTGTC